MPKQLQWAIGGLALLIVGFVALQIYLHVDMKNFRAELDSGPEIKTETPTTPNVVVSEEKPEDVPGFKWVRHGDHWDKVPVSKPDETRIVSNDTLQKSETVDRSPVASKNNSGYVEITDYSFLDNPEVAIRRQAEIILNRDKYSHYEYAVAIEEDRILSRKILDGYYGKGEYYENLSKFRDETLVNPRLAKQGLSIEMFRSMIRGEIPPMVIPMDSVDIR